MDLVLLFLDFYEQFLISSIALTLAPPKGSKIQKTCTFILLILLLFLSVRISNLLLGYEGIAIFLVIIMIAAFLTLSSQINFALAFLYICFIFIFLNINSSICYAILATITDFTIDEIHNSSYYLIIVIMTKINLSLLFIVIKNFIKPNSLIFKSKKWFSLLLEETFVFLCMIIFLEYYFIGYDPSLTIIGLLASAFLAIAVLYVFKVLNKEDEEKTAMKNLLNKLEFEHKYYENILNQYDAMKKLKHDFKHLSLLLIDYASKQKTDEIISILNSDMEAINTQTPIITGNEHLDYILNFKCIECNKLNIPISFTIEKVNLSFINETDLFVVIGNIIDNAIQHCNYEPKYISFSIYEKMNVIFISCSNPINAENSVLSSSALKTTKLNTNDHGYGMSSIQHIAEKYEGSFLHQVSNNVFIATVTFIKK